MRKFFKYLLGVIGVIFLLPFLIVFLLYLPPVQDFVKNKTVDYLEKNQGMVVKVGYFRLGFPLDLAVEDVYVGKTATDTLAAVGKLHLKVGLGEIFQQRLAVEELVLEHVKFGLSNDTTGMRLDVDVENLELAARKVDLKDRWVDVAFIRLAGGEIAMDAGRTVEEDTTVSAPLDWLISVDRVDLQEVAYRMSTGTMPSLHAGIAAGSLVGSEVALEGQTVDMDSLSVSGAWCKIVAAGGDTAAVAAVPADTAAALPWTVRVNSVGMENSLFSLGTEGEQQAVIALSGIGIRVDSVYNRGMRVGAQLKEVRAVREGGPALTSMRADVKLDSAETSLKGGYIRTLNSSIKLEARADADVGYLPGRKPLSLVMSGEVGMADVLPFYPELPQELSDKKVSVNTSFSLTNKRLQLGQLVLDMPGYFKITGSGSMADFLDVKKMRGLFILRGELPDVSFVQAFLPEVGVTIPKGMDLLTKVSAKQGDLQAMVRLCCNEGCLTLDGTYRLEKEAYDGELTLNRFPLYRFLPSDSLGLVSADVRLSGHSFDWRNAVAEAYANIHGFDYRSYHYQDVSLGLSLKRSRLRGTLTSNDKSVPLGLVFKGDSVGMDYTLSLAGRLGTVDVQALHFMSEPFTVGTGIRLKATVGQEEAYGLQVQLDSVKISDGNKRYKLGNLGVAMKSNLEATFLDLTSGDLRLKFRTDTSLMGFAANMGQVAEVVSRQIEKRDVDMEEVGEALPPFNLEIDGANKNAVSRFLQLQGVGFKKLSFGMVSRKRSGLRFGLAVNQPYAGTVKLDSVRLGAWQTGKSLMYSLLSNSSSDTWKGLFNIGVTGRMQGERFRVELKQKDAEGRVGFDLGVNTILGDSTLSVSFFPVNPILAYHRWMVNEDNRVDIGKHGKIRANLKVAFDDKLVSLFSLPDEGEKVDRLRAEIAGVDLSALSTMVPFMPKLNGELNTDLLLYALGGQLGLDGNVQVKELGYEGNRVGTLGLNVDYTVDDLFTTHALRLVLDVDSLHQTVVQGKFATSDTDKSLAVDALIPSFPLHIVNAFMPADLMKLDGELTGEVHLRGTLDKPSLNGGLAFRGGKADVVMLGTTFSLDTTLLPVKNGRLRFNKYRFIAPNNSDLVLNGEVVLTPFDRMRMDLAMDARNFELVNVKKNETSLIYGKAYANIHAKMNGPFSGLKMTGGINLLNSTDITYTLRSSGPAVVDKSIDLVRFTTFRDSTENEEDLLISPMNTSSFSMKMQIEIGNQVKAGVNLSEDGNDHVNIQGGGNLVLETSPESGMSLSGKYILTGGTVEYSVPIVGKKEFNIRNGSFVEWTGELMNPLLNISAAEQVKAEVEEGEQSRQVIFESIIRIQNNLSRPDITFDLSAPNDMVIQNQLATFSPEERTRQALNLLIYNTYTAPGAVSSSNNSNMANNAIYSFVENELNKYTRKAGLTLGFDSHNTEENVMRTDVTYQFSKELFNDRVRVKIGGRISTDGNEGEGGSLQDNLVDDISIEYVLTKRRNLFAKVFRHSNYESVLDGEVIQTGAGIVWRKTFRKFKDLFKNKNREERRALKMQENSERQKMEEEAENER